MHIFGVELWCCRCSGYLIIDTVIFVVVVMVCVPLFILFKELRAYTAVLLIVAIVFICRLWRFLPSHKRWVEQQACIMAAKLMERGCVVRPPAQEPCFAPSSLSTGEGGVVAEWPSYLSAAPSPYVDRYYSVGPLGGYRMSSSPFRDDAHLPYGGSTEPISYSTPLPPSPPSPLAIRVPSFPRSLSQPSPLSYPLPSAHPPCFPSLPPLQQVTHHTALGNSRAYTLSRDASIESRASSRPRSPAAAMPGGCDGGIISMRACPIPPAPLSIHDALHLDPGAALLSPNAHCSRQSASSLCGGVPPSSVFFSQGDVLACNSRDGRCCFQTGRSSSPPYAMPGEWPLWQQQRQAFASRSFSSLPPTLGATHYV
ncbi:hypothetical protein JKF63_04908 [Porcisia hertigi]|uniref:Uncharacterized protein n=1 Tax=Porcisia hertigi TaxID=2761500 RepID=A0A836L9W7_9TRYP|nr:hypothetical protein JKF63_04908 [Porcisia hertigi]